MAVVTINIEAEPITPIYTQVLLAFDMLYNEVCDNHKTPYQLDIASGGVLNNASSVYDMLNEAAPPGNYSDGITKANWDGIQLTNKHPCQASLPKEITITGISELNGDLSIQFNYSGFTPNTIIIDRSYDGGVSWPYSEGGSIISPRSTPMPTESAVYRLRDGLSLATSNLVAYNNSFLFSFSNTGRTSSGQACNETLFPRTMYSYSNNLDIGNIMYNNENSSVLSNPVQGADLWYQSGVDGISYRIDNNGVITAFSDCNAVPPPSYYEIFISNSTGISNCAGAGVSTYPIQVFVQTIPIIAGATVYNDSNLTSPFNGDGTWYSTSSKNSLRINSSGLVTERDNCEPPA